MSAAEIIADFFRHPEWDKTVETTGPELRIDVRRQSDKRRFSAHTSTLEGRIDAITMFALMAGQVLDAMRRADAVPVVQA